MTRHISAYFLRQSLMVEFGFVESLAEVDGGGASLRKHLCWLDMQVVARMRER